MRSSGIFFLSISIFLSLGFPAFPADSAAVSELYKCTVPKVIAHLSDNSKILKKDLLKAVLQYARSNNHSLRSVFVSPQEFMVYTLQLDAVKNGRAKFPELDEINSFMMQWRKYVESRPTGKSQKLPGYNSVLRKYLRDALEKNTGINEQNIKKSEAQWFGLNNKIVANIKGRDYTDLELAQYFICWSSDEELGRIIAELVESNILSAEAAKMEIDIEGLSVKQIQHKIFAPLINKRSLSAYYQLVEKELAVMKLREFIFDYSVLVDMIHGDDAENADSRPGLIAGINKIKKKADKFAAELKVTSVSVSDFECKYKYVYFCQDKLLAERISPYAYGFDYVYNNKGRKSSPIVMTPQVLRHIWSNVKPGVVVGPLNVGNSFRVYQIVRLYKPRNPIMLYDYLAQKRIDKESRRLIAIVGRQVKYNFKPQMRLDVRKLCIGK